MSYSPTICYLDCFSGVSGDMLLGALLHCGVEDEVCSQLQSLPLPGLRFTTRITRRASIAACQVEIDTSRRQELRTLPLILELLENSALDPEIKKRSAMVLTLLGEAEAEVHGIALEEVHFHEVGAVDTIVDIVGSLIALKELGVTKLVCSELPVGKGFVNCAHGMMPLPAPAVCRLLEGMPSYGVAISQELITPTGAALVKGLVDEFGALPPMRIAKTGYGAGSHSLDGGQPNLLRAIIGKGRAAAESQEVEVIETNIDDLSPEILPHLFERLLAAGALDVSSSAIQMKKGRHGFALQILADPGRAARLKEILLAETSTIGLRFRREQRTTLERKSVVVTTPWGEVEAKLAIKPDGPTIYPEYERCRAIAKEHGIPLVRVYQQIQILGGRSHE